MLAILLMIMVVKQKVLAESDDETLDESGITRAEARDAAIKELQNRFPDYIVEKAPRVHGSGIQIQAAAFYQILS